MAESRLIGSYPVIGIRPTIDGRRGKIKVRESLEDQTMNMAKSAAKLIEGNVFYSNGEHVKVIIADTTIGRVAEAAACEDKFKKAGVDITLTVTPCWCYGAETMDMNPLTIKAVWGFNGTERPGAVYLASVLATHAQKGLPAFGIYGHEVQEADDTTIPQDVQEKILRFARAAVAVATMPEPSAGAYTFWPCVIAPAPLASSYTPVTFNTTVSSTAPSVTATPAKSPITRTSPLLIAVSATLYSMVLPS